MAESKEIQKRKKVTLTVKTKIDICRRLENGENRRKIMQEYGIGSSTVYDIRKRKDDLLKFHSTLKSTKAIQQKTLRKPKLKELDTMLYAWFVVKQSEGTPISGPILKERAKEFYKKMKLTEKCLFSDGWLAGFKSRHGIRKLDINGEKKSTKEFINTFAKLVEENSLSPEQIYNAGKTTLLWRCLPDKTLAGDDEDIAVSSKLNKDNLTVLCCANASGTHRVELLVIGKYRRQRAFKNVQELPVQYAAQSNAWINKDMLKNWFLHTFVPSVKEHFVSVGLPENSKCALLLDNCSAHLSEFELCSGNIFVKYLPPNVTDVVQPMDQGVIQNMKCLYRRAFLRKLVNYVGTVKEFQTSFNVKDAIFNVACAWSLVKTETLRGAWKNLLPVIFDENTLSIETKYAHEDVNREEVVEIVSLFQSVGSLNLKQEIIPEEVREWLKTDEQPATTDTITGDDLVNPALNTAPQNFPNESSDEEEITNENVSWTAAAEAYNTLIKFAESKPCHSPQEIVQLHILQSIFLQKSQQRRKHI